MRRPTNDNDWKLALRDEVRATGLRRASSVCRRVIEAGYKSWADFLTDVREHGIDKSLGEHTWAIGNKTKASIQALARKVTDTCAHTPEPWAFTIEAVGGWSLQGNVQMRDGDIVNGDWIAGEYAGEDPLPPNEADLARIVACVNAMAGIPDPADLRQQYDRAVEACRAMVLAADNDDYVIEEGGIGLATAIDAARAVLAEAGGV